MRAQIAAVFVFVLIIPSQFNAQQTATRTVEFSDVQGSAPPQQDAKAVQLVNLATSALTGGTAVGDVRLNAAASWMSGPEMVTGTAVLQVKGKESSRLEITAGEKRRSEVRNKNAGEWADGDDTPQRMAGFNSLTPAAWFAPHALLASVTGSDVVLSYIGQEKRNGITVEHIRYKRKIALNVPKNLPLVIQNNLLDFSEFTAIDLYLHATSYVPLAITYNLHPDHNGRKNIPTEVRYADYRSVNGVKIPFRIQRLILGGLDVDLTLSSASFNSGLSDSEFALRSPTPKQPVKPTSAVEVKQ